MNRQLSQLALIIALSAPCLYAQTPSPIPVPSQFTTARTAFLASGGTSAVTIRPKDVTSMLYSSMYKAIANDGRYQLTSAPADAELSFVLALEFAVTDATHGNSFGSAFLRLSVYDTKTHTLLWNIDDPIDGAFREKTFKKNIDEATAKILADLKTLSSGSIPSNTAPKIDKIDAPQPTKTRMSQENQ